ncbi:MAG: class I SAM-dependent methyltransferase, partial [Candidatus Dormibacteraeota bacterium]|nr:class I SAM-dependent methyltransferase [Candidatus Dormibacteraeota bacterium]
MSIPKKDRSQTRGGGGQYFEATPQAQSRPRSVVLAVRGLSLPLQTDSGVFSAERLDAGTRVLLAEAPPPPAQGELLDLGCG